MVELEIPNRRWSVRVLLVAVALASASHAQPTVASPRWQVTFPAAAHGASSESTAVSIGGDSTMVIIMAAGANASSAKLLLGSRSVPHKLIGQDPVSRLGFVQVQGSVPPKAMGWVEDSGNYSNTSLQVFGAESITKARSTGWVKQVGGKVLPFSLLQVKFSPSVPPPGTPLLDEAGRVVAVVFQGSGSGNTGYAIPAEAVHRVKYDVDNGQPLIRGWLGLALRAESQIPLISRVLPDSPAAAAGIKPNDVLLSIGSRQITEYADAANAFFYLIPGQPIRVKLLRGGEPLEFTLTPTKPKG
jgi:S1-C subfamily serine protease